jgi:glycosyltransferase involved in cell wall biosynthesis
MARQKTYVIIPAYNEAKNLRKTLKDVLRGFDHVVCINDGSSDSTGEIAKSMDVIYVEHAINLGQGGGLQTGIEYALRDPQAMYFVTFDADGQHDVNDAKGMLEHLKDNKLDIVMGSRFLGQGNELPLSKKALLKLAVAYSNVSTGVKLSDTHNGLRVFNRKAAEGMQLEMNDMAHASEIIYKIGDNKLKYGEYPVNIRYTEYGQSLFNSINIVFDMLLSRISRR